MKTLDCFYENYVVPFLENLAEIGTNITVVVLSVILVILLWITLPVWIVPYMVHKKKGVNKNE